MANIEMIPIERLENHPKNVRKEYGDIEPLADSIRAQGVFQNLTVVQSPQDIDKYRVVIGNRRLMAAREAGLTELPCRIVEMDEPKQIETMIGENMQRSDLTVLEQADGVQMMLDLGETISTVAEKTGLSQTTVRHRAEIAKLDRDLIRRKEEDQGFQMTITDYANLEKVDADERNEVLEKAENSANLAYIINEWVKNKERQERKERIMQMLEDAGIHETKKYSYKKWEIIERIGYYGEPRGELDEAIKAWGESDIDGLAYTADGAAAYGAICIVRPRTDEDDESDAEQDAERARTDENRSRIKELWKKMAADRRDFITEATGRLNPYIDTDDMAQMTLDLMIELGGTISANSFAEFFTGKESYAITEPDKRDALEKTGELILHEELLCLMSNALTGHLIADWNNKCVDGVRKIAQKFYDEVLRKYGFTLTDAEEAALIDGSSKLYKGNEDKDDEVGGGQQEESEDEPNEADGQQEAVPVKRCGDCFHLWEINDEEGKCNCEDSDEYGKHKNKDQAGCSRWEEF